MYNNIINPNDGKTVCIDSKIGKKILYNYLINMIGGGISKQKTINDVDIYYVNLEKDIDRKNKLENNLKLLNLTNIRRIPGIYGKNLKDNNYRKEISNLLEIDSDKLTPEYFSKKSNFSCMTRKIEDILPKVGCYLAHLSALKLAYENKLDSLLLLEDDAIILPSILNNSEIFNHPSDADIVYLGGTFSHNKVDKDPLFNEKLNSKFIKIDPKYLTLFGVFGVYIPSFEKIKDMYNVYKSIFLDGPSNLSKKKWKDKTDNEWRSGNIRMMGCLSDRMLTKYFQNFGNTYVLNPVVIYHDMDNKSNLSDSKKYRSQQKAMSFIYDYSQQEYIDNQLSLLNKKN